MNQKKQNTEANMGFFGLFLMMFLSVALGLWVRRTYGGPRVRKKITVHSALCRLSSWLDRNHHLAIKSLPDLKGQDRHVFTVRRLSADGPTDGMAVEFAETPQYFAAGDQKPQIDTRLTVLGPISLVLVYKTGQLKELTIDGAVLTRRLTENEIEISGELLRRARRQVASYRPAMQ
ncbi:hypothetical protein HY224_01310 [Candidatus Uhrbacteria bacterium]|nr:hypothetical protein [Candidatus Uhrbacteria bacterium]